MSDDNSEKNEWLRIGVALVGFGMIVYYCFHRAGQLGFAYNQTNLACGVSLLAWSALCLYVTVHEHKQKANVEYVGIGWSFGEALIGATLACFGVGCLAIYAYFFG